MLNFKGGITYDEIRRNYRFGKEARSRSWHHILQLNTSHHHEGEGEEFGSQLKQKLSNVNFLSILTDASTDASNIEKEAVFVRYFESEPVVSNEVKICHDFVSLPDLESGKAGVVTAIEDSFKEIEAYDELTEKIVAFGADSASVNQGKHGGAIAEFRKNFGDWIIYIWCVSHRLELTLKDAFKGTPFDDIDEMLLQMYYLYEHSPKKIENCRKYMINIKIF